MTGPLPTVLVPGLSCSPRLYAEQIPALWRFGPVVVADLTRDDRMAAIVARILGAAPPRFALVGLSMGGYIAFEIVRQAPERVANGKRASAAASEYRPAAGPGISSACGLLRRLHHAVSDRHSCGRSARGYHRPARCVG